MTEQDTPMPSGEVLLYQTEDGKTRLEVQFQGETVWLSQAQMAELFQTTKQNVSLHIQNIYDEHELERTGTVKESLTVRQEGNRRVSRSVEHYNLDVVISVGYRVKSHRGVQFRIWATQRLREYIVKGFVMDDERLKNPPGPGVPDYFDELLERIRDIRASEKRMYLKVRDIFVLAVDYQPDAAETQQFFQIIQNKLHWAATGKTAAELINERADHTQPNMGLTAWKGAKVRKTDVTVAKNYLRENEIAELNRIVTMYLDYAEDQARRRQMLYMRDWREKLDAFLQFNERDILTNAGKVAKEVADRLALEQYDQFQERRLVIDAVADERAFEAAVKKLPAESPRKKPGKPKQPKKKE